MPTGTVTQNDVEQGWWFAGTALFGILKDTATLEERTAIYKKISLARVASNQPNIARSVLGQEFSELADIIEADPDDLKEQKPVPGGTGNDELVFKTPLCDKILALHREGLKELSKLFEKKVLSGNFQSLAEQNYCYMMKSFIDDLADGKSFTQSKLSNYQYLYAHSMTAKFRTTSATVALDENGEFKAVPIEVEDSTVLKMLDETGIIDAIAGGKKIADLTDEYLKNADVSRGELVAAYEQQLKRIEKHLELTEEEYNQINTQNPNVKVFDNAYAEVAGEDERGFGWAKSDIDAKVDALKKGYPVSDIQALAGYKILMDAVEKEIEGDKNRITTKENQIKEEEQKEKPNQESIQKWKNEIAEYQEKVKSNSAIYEKLDDGWYEAMGGVGTVDLASRKTNLQSLKKTLDDLNNPEKYGRLSNLIGARIDARLEEHEKTLLSDSIAEMLEQVEAVDPKLMKSSKAFRKFKDALKVLLETDKEMSNGDYWDNHYKKCAQAVLNAGAEYLQYKTRQLHRDPTHKRSELEEKRVRTVDAIIGKLSLMNVPHTGKSICDGTFNPIHTRGFEPDVVFDEVIDKSKKSYDSYIKLHTGRNAMNGNREEIIEDLSKVIAATALKKAFGEPFSKAEIDKQAKRIQVLYNLKELKDEDLIRSLKTPKTANAFIVERQKELSEVKDLLGTKNEKGNPQQYSLWWNNMSALYRTMKDPANVKSDAYKKLFETVKEAAHMPLPADAKRVNKNALSKEVARLNFKMMQYANIAVDEKGFQDKHLNHESLHVLYALYNFTEGAASIILDIDARVDKKRYDKDPESLKFVSAGKYGPKILYDSVKKQNNNQELRQPEEELIKKNTKILRLIPNEQIVVADIQKAYGKKVAGARMKKKELKKEIKNANATKTPHMEAPELKNRPKL